MTDPDQPRELADLLRPDGPHTDGYTTEVAGVFSESVRVLNHATRTARGLGYPQTVYAVLGGLSGGASGLGQLFHQLARFIEDAAARGRLADDSAPGADPRAAGERTRRHLGAAIAHAAVLAAELEAAHAVTARLYVPEQPEQPGTQGEGKQR